MAQIRTWAGLDVHAAKVVAASVDSVSGELSFQRLSGKTSTVVEFCRALPAPVKVTYEAGPTGFGLARELDKAGIRCVIAAEVIVDSWRRTLDSRSIFLTGLPQIGRVGACNGAA